jgi:hypothetical protein
LADDSKARGVTLPSLRQHSRQENLTKWEIQQIELLRKEIARERRELDEVYRRFVVVADRIKTVQDSDLLGLIRELREHVARNAGQEAIPSAIATAAPSGAMRPFPMPLHPAQEAGLGLSSVHEHHGEQEDYLWGV